MLIRTAQPTDAFQIAEFYRYYVEMTAINFEYEAPDAQEFTRRIDGILPDYPFLVAVEEGSKMDRVLGFLYAEPVSSRPAYAWSVKTSIYLVPSQREKGHGSKLYMVLEDILRRQHVVNVHAIITCSQNDDLQDIGSPLDMSSIRSAIGVDEYIDGRTSIDPHLPETSPRFHSALGYSIIGREIGSGYKFGTWYDKLLMQKKFPHPQGGAEAFLPFHRVNATIDWSQWHW